MQKVSNGTPRQPKDTLKKSILTILVDIFQMTFCYQNQRFGNKTPPLINKFTCLSKE